MKKLIRILSVFLALRMGEFIFGTAILGLYTYLGGMEPVPDARHLARLPASIWSGAAGVFTYYFFTAYLFTSLATPLYLAVRPNLSLAEFSGVNAGAFFASAWLPLPVMLWLFSSTASIPVGLLWTAVLVFDALFPICLRSYVKDVAFGPVRRNS
jgi:hypothetical protein